MSGKAAKRGKFFGRRQRRPVEELPNPMRRDDWVRWIELQRELEYAQIQDLLKFAACVPVTLCVLQCVL
jgi:hypothetical protein